MSLQQDLKDKKETWEEDIQILSEPLLFCDLPAGAFTQWLYPFYRRKKEKLQQKNAAKLNKMLFMWCK